MSNSDAFWVFNYAIVLLTVVLIVRPELTLEQVFKLIGFLLEHGVVYAYLGFWGVVASFDIGNGIKR